MVESPCVRAYRGEDDRVLSTRATSREVLSHLNPELSLAKLASDLHEIGYPASV